MLPGGVQIDWWTGVEGLMLGLVVEEQVEDKDTIDKNAGLPNSGVLNCWLLEYFRDAKSTANGAVKRGCKARYFAAGGIPRGIFPGRFEGVCNR